MTETLTLQRQPSTSDGTFGQIFRDGSQLCVTCERPWLNNAPKVSCILPGLYLCVPHNSSNHPATWQLQDVPGRSEILIHNGNVDTQSEGCILVGDTYGLINGQKAVLNSVLTLDRLRVTLPNTFYLNIIGAST